MGNILFLLGILFVIGPKSVMKCVLRGGNRRLKGTIALLGGVVIVFFRYSVIGVILEAYGAFVLFGDFAPQAIRFLRRIPIAGQVLSLPFISMIVDKIAGPRQPV
ncbi:hypothetical protein H696_00454 [Fonticula alba]|uniref:Uncharacterized protein n=1 Tax=Fonticula alba TaxID=691883 RepID=A0A058ZG30_FONAL|nr:hypothetical protein H696_00454 [Fonticula alba]KCV72883.1 hypothetical protein H696_00454 [Fonticula alba]|eukprot:XP_009492584.1 hypothetical protein H696_00454 [Fonticula alba]